MDNNVVTGFIETENESVTFLVPKNEFSFTFMANSVSSDLITLVPKGKFLYGKTHSLHDIAIYYGDNPLRFTRCTQINTWAYIKSRINILDVDIAQYKGIRFVGGTLNSVFSLRGMDVQRHSDSIVITPTNDSISCSIETNLSSFSFEIKSVVHETCGMCGSAISNSDVALTLSFESPQSLSTIFDHYNRMKDLLSFMTFRGNVGFEHMYLLQSEPQLGMVQTAEVFIKEDVALTDKHRINNLCFEDLENSLPKLIQLLYETEDKKPSISLGFIPINDQAFGYIDNTMVRAICSALETELEYAKDINGEESSEMKEFIRLVRKTVGDYKKEHPGLSNQFYSGVVSSIQHWSYSLSEKLCALFHKYEEDVINIAELTHDINDNTIREFVKYRNDITHGKHRLLTGEIADTAFYLCGVVYFSILERIGVSHEKMRELRRHKLLH